MNKKYLAALLSVLFLVMCFSSCSSQKNQADTKKTSAKETSEESSTADTAVSEAPESPEAEITQELSSANTEEAGNHSAEETETENDDIKIETAYGTMSYPYGFEEIVDVESEKTENAEQYVFYAVLDETRIKVYTVSFTSEEVQNGDLLGTIKEDSGKTVYVYMDPEENIEDESLSEDDQNTVYAAQETLNDVIASIDELPSFEMES